jgi:hypothetical protein
MAAVLLMFDRAARVHADLDEAAVLRRCRIAAITNGCTGRNRQAVEDAAKRMLAAGVPGPKVIESCAGVARELAKPTDQVPA